MRGARRLAPREPVSITNLNTIERQPPRSVPATVRAEEKSGRETLRVVKPNAIIFVTLILLPRDSLFFPPYSPLLAIGFSDTRDRKRRLNAVFCGQPSTITSRRPAKHRRDGNSVVKKYRPEYGGFDGTRVCPGTLTLFRNIGDNVFRI